MASMLEIPTTEPASFNAGDTVRWRKLLPGYDPADGWELEYIFASAGGVRTVAAPPDDAGEFVAYVGAADSTAWPAGAYTWRARVKKDGDAYTVAEGRCTVAPTFSQAVDARSSARRAMEAIKDYLANPDNLECASYTIQGRSLSRHSFPELWQHFDRLKLEVAREDAADRVASGLAPRGRVFVRFGR